jgi:4-hydroxybenzoate polyprenyltransferase
MRFAFLTNARTLCFVGIAAGLLSVVASVFGSGAGVAFAIATIVAGLLAYRQIKREEGEEGMLACTIATLISGVLALLLSLATLYTGGLL